MRAPPATESRTRRALLAFDADAFAKRHGGYKESRSTKSYEWLLPHHGPTPAGLPCGSDRLRWHHGPSKATWICWGCGKTGDTIDLISMLERVDRDGALGIVLDGYSGGDAPTSLQAVARVAKPSPTQLTELPEIAYPYGYELVDPRAPMHREAIDYLVGERGLTWADLSDYRIGYCRQGRLSRYVVFPVFMGGRLVYWQGRATWDPPRGLDREARKRWERETNYRKTLNPYDIPTGASSVVFNLDRAAQYEHVVVVEGPVDAIKVGPHAVALFGKEPTPEKVLRLLHLRPRRWTVYLDPGEKEREKALELAVQLADRAPTFFATPPDGFDPGKLTPAQNAWVLEQARPIHEVSGLLRSRLRL